MKRMFWFSAIFVTLFGFFGEVRGQGNPTCPTRPPGDSSNACASTAFVQTARGVAAFYDTRTAAIAANVPSNVDVITTFGYGTIGDGGGGDYLRGGTCSPASVACFTSADGASWKLTGSTINVRQFGAQPNHIVSGDKSAEFTDAINFYLANPFTIDTLDFTSGTYILDSQLPCFTGRISNLIGFTGAGLPTILAKGALTSADSTIGLLCFTTHGASIKNIALGSVGGGSGGSGISFIPPSTATNIGNIYLENIRISINNGSVAQVNYSIYADGSNATVAPVGLRNLFWSGVQAFGAQITSVFFKSVHNAYVDTSAADQTGGAGGNSLTVTGTVGVVSDNIQWNGSVGATTTPLVLDNVTRSSFYGLIAGNINNTSAVVDVYICAQIPTSAVIQTFWTTSAVCLDSLAPQSIFGATSTAFTVGRLGPTTPAFQVDTSTASSITGLKIAAAASGGGVAIAAIGETNVNTTINAAGSGTLTLQSVATGAVVAGTRLRTVAGLVGTPSITSSVDANSGLWWSGNSNIDFSVAGVNRFNVSASGLTTPFTYTSTGAGATALANAAYFDFSSGARIIATGATTGTGGRGAFALQLRDSALANALTPFAIANTGVSTFAGGTASTSTTTGQVVITGGLGVSGAINLGTYVKTGVTTVGALPTCDAGTQGARHLVTDANSTTFLATAAGGGANIVPVVCNATNWVIGRRPANDNTKLRSIA